jgi:hypothetical protein
MEYLPAAQSVHVAVPVIILYFPPAHAVHVPPLGPVNPGLQTQATKALLPPGDTEPDGHPVQVMIDVALIASEYVLAAQSAHAAAPVSILYFPATQAVHGPPLGPVCPRAQRQAETAVCPVADVTEFAGHA